MAPSGFHTPITFIIKYLIHIVNYTLDLYEIIMLCAHIECDYLFSDKNINNMWKKDTIYGPEDCILHMLKLHA